MPCHPATPRRYLTLHGLPTGGKKAEVVARVGAHVAGQEA